MKPKKSKVFARKFVVIFLCFFINSKNVWPGVISTPNERSQVEQNASTKLASPIPSVKSSTEETDNQNDVEHAALSAVKEETPSDQGELEKITTPKNNTTLTPELIHINTTENVKLNTNVDNKNETSEKPEEPDFLPEEGAAEKEHSSSLAIFFVLFVIILCVFFVHGILKYNCHHIPESLAIVFLGAVVGLIMKMLPSEDIKQVESFSPTMFFLVLLPPIIFESGYNLHKGELFANIRK